MSITFEQINGALLSWLVGPGARILAILVVTLFLRQFGMVVIDKAVRKMVVSDHFLTPDAEKKREDTLVRIFQGTFRVLLWLVAILMILSELGMNIGPILAGAGVAGLAVGFGGQYLIRDIVSGLFLILENQFRVGDVVCIGKTCGLVEDVTLRMTVLRDLDGTVHHIPNGEIHQASNLSKNFARVNLDVGVSYAADLEKVIQIINRVGKELAEDPKWKDKILKTPQFLRVNDFADSAIMIKILGDTQPLKQWEVTGELRKRLKIAFDAHGIEIPFPQRVVHMEK